MMESMEARLEGSELQRLMEEEGLTHREVAERARGEDSVIGLAWRKKQRMSVVPEKKVAGALGVEVSDRGVVSSRYCWWPDRVRRWRIQKVLATLT